MGSSLAKEMKRMAKRDAKAFIRDEQKKDEIERKKLEQRISVANDLRNLLIERAMIHGGDSKDPFFTLCICAEWGERPHVRGNKLIVGDGRARSENNQIVGEMLFSPVGGIRGVIVLDQYGDAMVMEGDCRRSVKWSHATRGFHLLPKYQPAQQ